MDDKNTNDSVYEKALELVKCLDYDSAKSLLESSLKENSKDTELLDLYSEVLINLDLTEEAIKVLLWENLR